jgi:hypothetical protein
MICKKTADVLADQFVERNSQDSRRRRICIQTIAVVIND